MSSWKVGVELTNGILSVFPPDDLQRPSALVPNVRAEPVF